MGKLWSDFCDHMGENELVIRICSQSLLFADGSVEEMSLNCGFDTVYSCGYRTYTQPFIDDVSQAKDGNKHHWIRHGSPVSKFSFEFRNVLFERECC